MKKENRKRFIKSRSMTVILQDGEKKSESYSEDIECRGCREGRSPRITASRPHHTFSSSSFVRGITRGNSPIGIVFIIEQK